MADVVLGKTSTAKILARAINCINPKDGEPCNECEICKGILSGSLTDVIEMDAASNNSVEDIRVIRDEVNFMPTVAKYRVYIIDEVHMLSTGAFNALLKTLEEPPEHVKFILATTEPQKLPATILSRCQRFDFKQISIEDIIKRLKIVCKESNIEITEEALKTIAVLAEGGLRDAISILERCIQEQKEKIDENTVKDLIGIPRLTYINKVVKNIFTFNTDGAMDAVNEVIKQGKDLDNFLWEIIKYIKDILLYKSNCNMYIYSKEELKEIEELSQLKDKEELLKLIYDLSELANNIKWSSQKIIMFEAGILKSCMDLAKCSNKPKKDIQENMQKELQKADGNKIENRNKKIPEDNLNKSEESADNKNDYINYWNEILEKLKKSGEIMLYTNLIGTKAKKLDQFIVAVEFNGKISEFAKAILEKHESKSTLESMISEKEGKKFKVKYISASEKDIKKADSISNKLKNLAKETNISINIIEE